MLKTLAVVLLALTLNCRIGIAQTGAPDETAALRQQIELQALTLQAVRQQRDQAMDQIASLAAQIQILRKENEELKRSASEKNSAK